MPRYNKTFINIPGSFCYNLFILLSDPLVAAFANCSDGALRLVGRADPSEGRLEVCINNAWGSICDRLFGNDDAEVACLQLGGFSRSGT